MIVRAFSTVTLLATAAMGCAKAEEAPESQRAEPGPQSQAEQTVQAPNTCWTRNGGGGLGERASAFDSVMATVGGQTIKLCYSRPQMKGRTIMGGLVPYGQPWRLGANEATVIHMPASGTVAGVPVAAGSYSLYAVPDAAEWRIFVNRNAQRWGIPINDAVRTDDAGSGAVKTENVRDPVEAFTARFDQVTNTSASLVLEWERTRVGVPVTLGPQ